MPEAETQACLTLSLIFSNWHSVYTLNALCCWSTPSLHQRYLGLCSHLKLEEYVFLNINVRYKGTEMWLFWPNRPVHFPMAYCPSPLSSAIHTTADWGSKQLREQNMTALLLQCFLWKECSQDIPVHHCPRLFFQIYKIKRIIHILPEAQPTLVFTLYNRWLWLQITEQVLWQVLNTTWSISFLQCTIILKCCYQNIWSLVLLPIKFLTKT